jgi:probable HAF family extracellular repeat protein
VVGVGCGAASGQAVFTWCGGIPDGQWLNVAGVAAGGAAITGTANFPTTGGGTMGRAYRWTPATGIVNLGTLPSTLTFPYSDAYAVSADGQVVVGGSFTSFDRGFRWSGGVMAELPVLAGTSESYARAMTPNGATIVGSCAAPAGGRVVRWTAAGVEDLGAPPWRAHAGAAAVSADGAVIVGTAATVSQEDGRAFVLEGGVWTDLGVLPGMQRSEGRLVSADGRVVVGRCLSPLPAQPQVFVWTREGGMQPLPPPAGVASITPLGISGDGAVIVGSPGGSGPDPDGFVWTRWGGMRNCKTVLQDMGVNLDGWTGVMAWDLTADGRTLAGTAKSSTGYRAWVATLPEGFGCYANCDGSTAAPALSVNDFVCFQARYAAGDPGANCDGSTAPPVLNINDFICFQGAFAAGCP